MIQNTNIGASKTYVNQNIGVWNWLASHTYATGDVVTYNGTLYVSLQNNNTNQNPSSATAYWSVYNKSGSESVGTDTKPIKLVNGVPTAVTNDLVDVSSAQTIPGAKTFTSGLTLTAYQSETINFSGGPKLGTNTSATQCIMRLYKNTNDTEYVARDTVYQGANTKNTARLWYLQRQNSAGTGVDTTSLMLGFTTEGGYVTIPNRTYNASNTADAVNIALLDQYTPMVRTTGNQTIGGIKTFTGQIWAQNTVRCATASNIRRGIVTIATNGTSELYFMGNFSDTSTFQIATYQPNYKVLLESTNEGVVTVPNQRAYSAGNTTDVATIGTLDAYTPMVRTSGNQTIEGEKTFQSYMIGRVSGDPVGAVGGNLTGDATKYVIMATMNLVYNSAIRFGIYGCANNQNFFESEYVFACSRADSTPALYVTHKRSNSPNTAPKIYYTVDANNVVTFYGKTVQYCSQNMYVLDYFSFGNKYNPTAANRVKIATNAGTEVALPADAIEEVVLTERI